MASLFLDTSINFKIGVLADDFSWLSYNAVDTKRTSEIIHNEINNILSGLNLSIKELVSVFVLSGPGSYTGMRVAEGVAQILELEGVEVFSFTTFRLGSLYGEGHYQWLYEAFKGELYLQDEQGNQKLLKLDDFKAETDSVSYFSHGASSVAGIEVVDFCTFIKNQPCDVFSLVQEGRLRDKPFYFRPLDVEFKKSTK